MTTITRDLWNPTAVTVDRSGNIYVTDGGYLIRKVAPDGAVTTVNFGSTGFQVVGALTCDGGGNLYFAGYSAGKNTINKITPEGVITQVAGIHADGLAMGKNGILYASDGLGTIMTISPEGTVTTIAGVSYRATHADGPAPDARFGFTTGVALDRSGILYVAEQNLIRKISRAGHVTTFAGGEAYSYADGQGNSAAFSGAHDLSLDGAGNIYVADRNNCAIRKITPDGMVSTLAGGRPGSADGIGRAAGFNNPSGITSDSEGNLYVADTGNNTVRQVTPAGLVTTIAGLAGEFGSADGQGRAARFSGPSGVTVDGIGNVYVADTGNSTIRKITPDGNVSTVAGFAGVSDVADGAGSVARFEGPIHMAIDASGDLYVADQYSIRRMDPAGAVTTVAGNYRWGNADGTGTEAQFAGTYGVAIDSIGNLYIADATRIRIGRVALSDAATIDQSSGKVAGTRRFDTSSHTADKWQWTVIRRPVDSVAELSSATVRNPTFTPDVPGLFQFKLVASNGEAMRISTIEFVSLPVPVRRHAVGH